MKITSVPVLFLVLMAGSEVMSADLWFREDFAETPPEIPVQQKHLANPELILKRHGPGEAKIKRSFHENKPGDPHYVWSGLCPGNWAISFEHKEVSADLSKGKVKWRTKQASDRVLYVIVKTPDGWMVSGEGTPKSKGWEISGIQLAESEWYEMDIEKITKGSRIDNPDLSKVKSVGCTDLMPGGRSKACSRLDWIEVYRK